MSQDLTIEEERAIFYGALTGYGAASTATSKPQLSRGSTDPAVIELQTLLVSKGYSIGTAGIDGKYGGDTETAVKQFQTNSGLSPTGVVDTFTWQALLPGSTGGGGQKAINALDDFFKGLQQGISTVGPLFTTPQTGAIPQSTTTAAATSPPTPGTPWGTIALVGGGVVVLGLLIWGGSKLIGGGE